MTGPEHFKEAERLITEGEWDEYEPDLVMRDIALAQVHATLALAAATALQPSTYSAASPTYKAWRDVAGEQS